MNYAELGQRVKQKYPDYANVDDETLGRKVAAKYPEYEVKIDHGNALTNFLPSLGKNLASLGEAGKMFLSPADGQVAPSPFNNQLTQGLERMGIGAVEKLIPGRQQEEAYADAAGKYYGDRYGGVENIKRTFNEDPVGTLLDLSTILDAGGSLIGKAGDVSKISALTKAGNVAKTASHAVNPIEQLLSAPGKVIGAVGKSRAGRAVQAPFAGSYDPEVAALAQEKGINAPVSMTNRSGILRSGEAVTQKGLLGQPVQKRIQAAQEAIARLGDDLTQREVRPADLAGTGKDVKRGFTQFRDTFREQKSAMYDAVTPQVSQAPGQFSKTQQALEDIITSKQGSFAPGTNVGFYQQMLDRIRQAGGATIDNIRQTRTQVGAALKNHNDPVATGDAASLNKVYAALSDDLDESIRAVDPALGNQLDAANAYYRDTIQKINSRVGKDIAHRNPEQLVDDLIKPNSETDVALVKEIIGDEAFGRLQEEFLQKLLNKATKTATDHAGSQVQRLDYTQLTKQLDRYGDPTLKKLFTPEQYQRLQTIKEELRKIDRLDRAFKAGSKAAQGSQTAFLGEAVGMGFLATHPALLAQYVLSRGIGVGLFGTQRGARLLNQGVDVTTPVGNALSTSGRIAGATAKIGNVAIPSRSGYQDALKRAMEQEKQKSGSARMRLP